MQVFHLSIYFHPNYKPASIILIITIALAFWKFHALFKHCISICNELFKRCICLSECPVRLLCQAFEIAFSGHHRDYLSLLWTLIMRWLTLYTLWNALWSLHVKDVFDVIYFLSEIFRGHNLAKFAKQILIKSVRIRKNYLFTLKNLTIYFPLLFWYF